MVVEAERPSCDEAFVLASGPSLAVADCDAVRRWKTAAPDRRHVFAVNNSYERAPWVDVLYAGDHGWFQQYHETAARRFFGSIWTGSVRSAARWPDLKLVKLVPGRRLPDDGICVGGANGNSGLQAMCLAALFGARRIGLLGFDGGPAINGPAHWHADHPAPLTNCLLSASWDETLGDAVEQLDARGVFVTNCSRSTSITSVERGRLSLWLTS